MAIDFDRKSHDSRVFIRWHYGENGERINPTLPCWSSELTNSRRTPWTGAQLVDTTSSIYQQKSLNTSLGKSRRESIFDLI